MNAAISPSSFDFLKQLEKNNNRDWFAKHKDRYDAELAKIVIFADDLLERMNKHDQIENESGKKCLFRIYRDTRFSKDKTPYKNHWSGNFKRATKKLRGSYYFHIEPGKSFVGGGFWGPEPADLKRIRDEIAYDAAPFYKIFNSKTFKSTFGTLKGDQIQTTPKGFDPKHADIQLLRYKQFVLKREFTDKDVLAPDFVKEVNETFKRMRPFLDHMSEVLTTDVNGISLV
ncbi:MAG TPA: DUF2461 domain-containing protein [Bacteroidia bacterium]|jgi:uncharacterized protein (TIGR02453 family)|nr:DUF2461 domain-containing protein [Bacteroidia bacterium]